MSRYIDADALKNIITDLDEGCAIDGIGFDIYTYEVFELIDEAPAADVRENIRGEWIHKDGLYGVVFCSKCDYELHINNTNFCPKCGAYMKRKEINDGDDFDKK